MVPTLLGLTCAALPVLAAEDDSGDEPGAVVTIVGSDPREISTVPGSATVLTTEDLDRLGPLSATEALAQVPGLTVVEEDALGLRQNIGVRGLLPDRSGKVLVLEDGVPVALAPYGEPALYYGPVVDRMARIEVVKGSGSILFGPQTVGGVIDYRTHASPADFLAEVEARVGTWGHLQGRGVVGDTVGQVGYRFEGSHLVFAGERDLDVVRTDMSGRLDLDLEGQEVMVKVQAFSEASRASYLGLTAPQFAADPLLSLAVHDLYEAERYAAVVRHGVALGRRAVLVSTFYTHNVERDWRRQDFDRTLDAELAADEGYERIVDGTGALITDCQAVPAGEEGSCPEDGSAVFFRDSSRTRSRHFYVAGVEERLSVDLATGPLTHAVQVGMRGHIEAIEERIWTAEQPQAVVGQLDRAEDRVGMAVAGWLIDRVGLAEDRVQLSPGVRVEAMSLDNSRLADEGDLLDPPATAEEALVEVLPGLGLAAELAGPVVVFAGTHRGFSPPRTKDTLTTDGDPVELEAERAWNHELGLRVVGPGWLRAEVAGFLLDFDNQVVAPTESSGAVGQTAVNSGESLHTGAEAAVWVDPAEAAGWGLSLPVALSGTALYTELGAGWGAGVEGNRAPYAPALQGVASVGAWAPWGLGAQVRVHHVGAMYADRDNTRAQSTDGLVGRIPARTVLDARLAYEHHATGLGAFVQARNLLDAAYIASRAPRGIQPGARRHLFVGLEWGL